MSPVSSLASLCRHRLIRCATRLSCDNRWPVAAAHFPAFDRRRSLSSSGLRRDVHEDLLQRFRDTTSRSSSGGGAGRPAAGFSTWARLAIGSTVAVATPFAHSKWASFLRIQNEVEMVKDAAEAAAEVVEEVATAAEKVSSEVAGHLPEDGGLRRAVVIMVEHASKEVAEEAHLARDIIHKVDEIEEDVKAIIKPIVDHGKHKSKP